MIPTIAKRTLAVIGFALIGVVLVVVAVYLSQLTPGSDLQPWHLAELDGEFRASRADEFRGLDDYRRLEDRLFAQLQEQVYERSPATEPRGPSRFGAGSLVDPARFDVNWNRTFEMSVEQPLGAVLMLHGLSDSPYSMRPLAETLHEQGFWVVGLRIPGHGTAPAGLVDIGWQDFAAATRMAAGYLSRQVGRDRPFFLVGHSLGAALAVEYSLAVLQGEELPAADALVLISPAIGIPRVAPPARLQGNLADLLGLEKSDWISILPEFDPYRYNSLALNAGEQLYALNEVIAERIERLAEDAGLVELPRVLAFQSAVDSTVPPEAVVNRLLRGLKPIGHELVLFDLNRHAEALPFLDATSAGVVSTLMADDRLPFDLTLVTNRAAGTNEVMARRKSAQSARVREQALGMAWPYGVYSLAHIGLPFPPDDPLYGASSRANDRILTLGNLELRGEPGVLAVPAPYLNRLRYNPFFAYLEHRVVRTLTDIAEGR
jgi:alpha-beta hydrolase superfamily lysophospholipase